MEFGGRVALVTGASSGIGRRFALDLAQRGTTVVGVARGAERLAAVESELHAAQPGSWTRALDVGDADGMKTLIDEIVATHGRLDILINNAAIEERRPALESDPGFVRRIMRVNLDGAVHGTLAALPHMVERGEGWIVSVTSGAGRAPIPYMSAYAASKAALVAFHESISYEVEPKGVKVKILSPGFVGETAMAQASVEAGLPVPPKSVRRTLDDCSRALFRGLDKPGFEINVARLEVVATVVRALMPRVFRRNVRRMHA